MPEIAPVAPDGAFSPELTPEIIGLEFDLMVSDLQMNLESAEIPTAFESLAREIPPTPRAEDVTRWKNTPKKGASDLDEDRE